ncbi:uncharacterized protein LOC103524116 [Trichonephila clavipes]|nr:uncharacterized protein LOC103524116 [Trichonephila clavipes]
MGAAETLETLGYLFYVVSPNRTTFEKVEDVPDYQVQVVPFFFVLVISEYIINFKKNRGRLNDAIGSISQGILSETVRTDCTTYLGISLDSRLTWTKHIAKVVENATSRLSLLKKIAGVKWGSSQSVLTFTFTSYIRPVIDYGFELLVTASDSALSKLDIVQNKALRFITGAATSTPIVSMQLQTAISSSSERRQYSALSLGERLMRKENFWPKYIPSQTRLKTQHTFLSEFHRLANVFGVSDNRLPLFRPTIFPGHLRYASANLDLVLPTHKHNSLLSELRSAALATIHERYPDQDWLYVFTDGSATAPFGRAGAGAFSDSFNLKEPLSAWSDNFDGEIYAIFMAFRAISTVPGLNIVIFIDSQAAIKTVSGYNLFPSKLEFECKQLIKTHFFAPEERSFSNGSHLIAVFMEMNKPTSWPKRLRRCIHLAI